MLSNINRTIIEASIGTWIEDIKKDKRRSLRRLVEMGAMFSRNGRQSEFFDMASRMLDDENSPYYSIIGELAERTNTERLKRFSVDFGYNGLMQNITPVFSSCYGQTELANSLKRAEGDADRAFILFLRGDFSLPEAVPCNVMLSIPFNDPRFDDFSARLEQGGFIWCAYVDYSEAEASDILSDELCAALCAARCLFCFFIADDDVTRESRGALYRKICKKRTEQQTALFPIEFDTDVAYISGSIG